MLARQCRSSFDPVILSRGMNYFRSGRVMSCIREGSLFRIKVRGSDGTYRIHLDFQNALTERKIQGRCDCSYYRGGDLCQHLWAGLLRVDSERRPELFPENGPIAVLHEKKSTSSPSVVFEESVIEAEEISEKTFVESVDTEDHTEKTHADIAIETEVPPGLGSWQQKIGEIQRYSRQAAPSDLLQQIQATPTKRGSKVAFYAISSQGNTLVMELFYREILRNGELGILKPWKVSAMDLEANSDHMALDEDQELISWLLKIGKPASDQTPTYRGYGYYAGVSKVAVEPAFHLVLIPRVAATGRLLRGRDPQGKAMLRDDSRRPWEVEVTIGIEGGTYVVEPRLVRGHETLSVSDVQQAYASGFIFLEDSWGRLSHAEHFAWITSLKGEGAMQVPQDEAGQLLQVLLNDPKAPKVFWPPELRWTEKKIDPRVRLVFSSLRGRFDADRMLLELSFEYPGMSVLPGASFSETGRVKVDSENQSVYSRNEEFETQILGQVERILSDVLAAKSSLGGVQGRFVVERNDFSRLASRFIEAGWEVLAQGKKMRLSRSWEMSVSSGVNWFDLGGKMNFEGKAAEFPELLAALKSGQGLVELGDGTVGVLPSDWLARYAPLMKLGQATDESVRFHRTQGLFLDAWLADEKQVQADLDFQNFQKRIRSFEGIPKKNAPSSFRGKLRPYQREGLSWFCFAEEFGIGGILADDMGLGKTVQFLAFLLDFLKRNSKNRKPHIVVAPKSLVFNWIEEAARFAPKLKIVNYTGKDRASLLAKIPQADLVITTYPVIRGDIDRLKKFEFDLAVVDEAQSIKNPKSQVAQACKALKARYRFAMTGTPIENSLQDLFSILDFTSPGLLDFPGLQDFGEESRGRIAQALRPVILRRTKSNVLKELPDKTEQTIYCEMSPEEERRYAELREHYRASIFDKISEEGWGRAKFHVLEALLRLRQAACHPGLIDAKKKGESSAKLDHLMDQLQEVISEGHKVLVFSQFTRFLGIVEARLRQDGISYEYLDGKTENRQQRVEHFQTDPSCQVFLISLKAGGTGLNLTAASYVFLLDPWWNPAVEAQAIDRVHRIGQERKVFAYRMIARGTVEEKILELQKSKRALAEAMIAEDEGFLRKMSREDVEILLGP